MQTLRSRYKTVQGKWSGLNWRIGRDYLTQIARKQTLPVTLARLNTSLFPIILASGDKCAPAAHALCVTTSPIRAGPIRCKNRQFSLTGPVWASARALAAEIHRRGALMQARPGPLKGFDRRWAGTGRYGTLLLAVSSGRPHHLRIGAGRVALFNIYR